MIIFTFVVATAMVFWGGYQGARRFPVVSALAAMLLLVAALLLIRLDLSPSSLGDGAPSSAGAALGLLLLIEILGILLAGTLLLAGWREHDNPFSKALFLFLFLPFAGYAVYAIAFNPGHSPAKPPVRKSVPIEQQGGWKDGYVWAIDSQFLADEECRDGSPDFLVGCRAGVAKNRAQHQ